ncbi:C25 family cysteine peptidase [Flavobacterium soli]|uniref:C25 family cysteine peptidase n=1 Tax=Flavobacterium soli TaxID=344881 RepID=UPI0003F86619|nr:C25 family cysteine peptidase [Flavobacterium soli]
MKINYLSFLLLIVSWNSFSQDLRMLSSHPEKLIIQNSTPQYTSVKKSYNGIPYENFSAVAKAKMMQTTAPELPVFSESLIVPNTGDVSIEVTFDGFQDFQDINILPSKGSLKRNVNPEEVPYVFGATYEVNDFFPKKLADISGPYIFRDARGVTVIFYPYQYNPVTKVLRVYQNLKVTVTTDKTKAGHNEKPSRTTSNSTFQSLYTSHFLNAEISSNSVTEPGEMLIVSKSSYNTSIQPLVTWKNQSGIKTTVLTLANGATTTSIKNSISSFYTDNPNLTYVLLVGDHQDLPAYSYGITGADEQLWSDSYYGQLEGDDYYPELMIGRLSGNTTEVQKIVTKIMGYEKNPLTGDWMTKAGGIGSNEGYGYGDDGEADWQHLRNIGTQLTGFGYTNIYEFYDDSQGGNDAEFSPDATMISAAINDGIGLLNYTGHGALDIMSTGSYTNTDVNSLTNEGSFPFVVSVACNNGTFVGGTSLCEAFLKSNHNSNPTGAIASCGSSILMAWAEPMQTQDQMTELIIDSNSAGATSLGELFYGGQVSMLETYSNSGTAQEVMQTWVFFGDPSVTFRSAVPTVITATHPAQVSNQGVDLVINSNTDGAKITVSQNNEILATGVITGGTATVQIPALASMDNLMVTLTKKETTPYQGIVTVSSELSNEDFQSQFLVYPNPASNYVTISNKGNNFTTASISIIDINGRVLSTESNVNLSGSHQVSFHSLAAGVYFLSIKDGNHNNIQKIVVQ